jgi:DDE superfamily endonuclease
VDTSQRTSGYRYCHGSRGALPKLPLTMIKTAPLRGAAGRAQVAVYLAYAAPAGTAFIDRALYLPESWTGDPARCRAAGVPPGTAFATKPTLATRMIGRALDAGRPAAWTAADEVYGAGLYLRAELARRGARLCPGSGQHPPDHHRDRAAPGDRAGPTPGPTPRPGLSGRHYNDYANRYETRLA